MLEAFIKRINAAVDRSKDPQIGRCGIYRHFDKLDGHWSLAAYWFAESGQCWFQPRGRERSGGQFKIHDRISEPVSVERCAEMLVEHGCRLTDVRMNPVVTLTYASDA